MRELTGSAGLAGPRGRKESTHLELGSFCRRRCLAAVFFISSTTARLFLVSSFASAQLTSLTLRRWFLFARRRKCCPRQIPIPGCYMKAVNVAENGA